MMTSLRFDLEQVFFPRRVITGAKLLAVPKGHPVVVLYIGNDLNARVELGREIFYLSVERAFAELSEAMSEALALLLGESGDA